MTNEVILKGLDVSEWAVGLKSGGIRLSFLIEVIVFFLELGHGRSSCNYREGGMQQKAKT